MSKENIAFTAPHWAATEAGIDILQQGGSAVEAMVAAAAVISVVYPHMNSIGGDSFWLIDELGQKVPTAIDACGRSANQLAGYQHLNEIPNRGGKSALTQAATIRGWQLALQNDQTASLPLSALLAPAIKWAEQGFTVSDSLQSACKKLAKISDKNHAFNDIYYINQQPLIAGQHFNNLKLAQTFKILAKQGLDAFYHGPLAESFISDLQQAGSCLTLADHANTQAQWVKPLTVQLSDAQCFNLPAPTQGVHSLQILAIIDQLKHHATSTADWVHLIVEATKQSFNQRSKIWADLTQLSAEYEQALSIPSIKKLAKNIQIQHAKPWPEHVEPGDTIWMGARDCHGKMVSFIQSIYWEFGSGVAMSEGGFVWNNRGVSFSLNPKDINQLAPNKKPSHTLNPAFAKLEDGSRLAYGTMGGEGQPQTQAAIFSGFVWQGKSLSQAISDDRWLLGRTWGDSSTNLKVETHLANKIGDELTERQHDWQTVTRLNEMMGHAGAIADSPQQLSAATDPRSNGLAITAYTEFDRSKKI